MNNLTPHIARHIFPTTIVPMLEHAGLIGLPWEILQHVQGSWLHTYGIDGQVHLDKDGRVKGLGNHLGIVYNDPMEMVIHRASNSVRLRVNKEGYVTKSAVGPHCCSKFSSVTRHMEDGVLKSETVAMQSGRTETRFFDEEGRLVKFVTGPNSIEYFYHKNFEGPLKQVQQPAGRETQYTLDYYTNFPVRLMSDEKELAAYTIVREKAEDNKLGRVIGIQVGAARLLDFTALWRELDAGKYPEFKSEFEARWGEKDNV